jgi:hypothetical protein
VRIWWRSGFIVVDIVDVVDCLVDGFYEVVRGLIWSSAEQS